ncbi:hypothetical protein [Brevibacillus invocatus]|uniref:hypothetical protein n=1 Tax=Brevibacillus invocatus TaxID=173959 RepID=UPI00203DEA3B|nr:hypothetical protein [Brevibacillus invocatus]MCM3081919.1 hypothetical protein [Brevibacillus invocatus]MCM3432325.1 hypothetical protein [Brevibacillus invocatus]
MLYPNLPTKTLGGSFFWDTLDRRNGWKLQKNIMTEHYRILDPENVRQAWSNDEVEMWHAFRKFTSGSRE